MTMTRGTLGPQWIDDEIGKANALSEAPERIWVDTDSGELEDYGFDTYTEPFESADEYVHRSLYDAQAKVIEAAKETLTRIAKWREECHDHDRDMGHEPRAFDDEDWKLVEYAANSTLAALDRQCAVCGGWVYVGDACCPKCSPEALAALQEFDHD